MTAAVAATPGEYIGALLEQMGSVRSGRKHQCPAHALTGEHSQSLALDVVGDRVLLFCHAGCSLRDVLGALRLPMSALHTAPLLDPTHWHTLMLAGRVFPSPRNDGGSPAERGFRYEAEHAYGHPAFAWKVRLRHPTTGAKELSWESLSAAEMTLKLTPKQRRARAVPGLLGRRQVDLPLYREHEIGMAIATNEIVVLVESESSVDALMKAGIYATTWPGGAADPPVEQIRDLLGAYQNTVLIPDNDEAGLTCRDRIVGALPNARVLLGDPSEDARDLLTRVGADEFRRLITETLT